MHQPPQIEQPPPTRRQVLECARPLALWPPARFRNRPSSASERVKSGSALLIALSALALTATAADQKPLSVVVGQELTLRLESDSSSGCQWLLAKPLDAALLKQSPSTYQRGPKGGHEVLKFTALAEGKTELHFKYAKLWDKETNPSRQTNFVVVVTKEKARAAK